MDGLGRNNSGLEIWARWLCPPTSTLEAYPRIFFLAGSFLRRQAWLRASFLLEHLEEWILVRDVLLRLRVTYQVHT
jgi:hypothetical protein